MTVPDSDLIRIVRHDDDAYWKVVFGRARGNILDIATLDALGRVFAEARDTPRLKVVCLEGAGNDFSFGASVPEHLPDRVVPMLESFRRLLFAVLESDVVTVAAVRD